MASAAKKQHRIKEPVRAHLDRETGKFEAFIVKKVVETVEDPLAEWTVEEARDHKANAEVGDEIHLPISTDGLGRIAAQNAKQVLYQRVREAERENIYNEYIDRVGEVLNGTVKRFERGDIIVDLGRTEAVVPRSEQARHERYSQGERIRAVIVDVHKQPKGPQIVLSRTDPRLLVKLFETEVPEIYDGTVVIKNAVRAPGERAKVAVYSRERDVDPVGACVGMKGSRVQSIIRELRGEKIDIIEYSDDLVTFAQSALAPAKITRVSVTHQGEVPHLDVIVEDEQLSLAIGKRGQNVRLASELIGSPHRHQERERRQGRGGRRPRPHAADRDGRRSPAPARAGGAGREARSPASTRWRPGSSGEAGLRQRRDARRTPSRRRCWAWAIEDFDQERPRRCRLGQGAARPAGGGPGHRALPRCRGGRPQGRLDGRRGFHGGPLAGLRRERAAARERGAVRRRFRGRGERRGRQARGGRRGAFRATSSRVDNKTTSRGRTQRVPGIQRSHEKYMGKIRVQDLAKMMGISNQDLVFKLKSIGVRVEGDDAHIDTDIIQAIC